MKDVFQWQIEKDALEGDVAILKSEWFRSKVDIDTQWQLTALTNQKKGSSKYLGLWIRCREACQMIGDSTGKTKGYNGCFTDINFKLAPSEAIGELAKERQITTKSISPSKRDPRFQIMVIDKYGEVGSSLCDVWYPLIHPYECRGSEAFVSYDRINHFSNLTFVLEIQYPTSEIPLKLPLSDLSMEKDLILKLGSAVQCCHKAVMKRSQTSAEYIGNRSSLDLGPILDQCYSGFEISESQVLDAFVKLLYKPAPVSIASESFDNLTALAVIFSALDMRAFFQIVAEKMIDLIEQCELKDSIVLIAMTLNRTVRTKQLHFILWREFTLLLLKSHEIAFKRFVKRMSFTASQQGTLSVSRLSKYMKLKANGRLVGLKLPSIQALQLLSVRNNFNPICHVMQSAIFDNQDIFQSFLARRHPSMQLRFRALIEDALQLGTVKTDTIPSKANDTLDSQGDIQTGALLKRLNATGQWYVVREMLKSNLAIWLKPLSYDIFSSLYSRRAGSPKVNIKFPGARTAQPVDLARLELIHHPYAA